MSSTPPLAALPLAQHLAGLWARAGTQLYAVVDAAVVPGLNARLAQADVRYDCLKPGALSPREARQAGYVVQMQPGSKFADWLFTEAVKAHPDWGVAVVCPLPLLAVRQHLRQLGSARRPDGRAVPLRWWEPALLGALLPLLAPQQLDAFFGPIEALVLPQSPAWTWYAPSAGQLVTEARPVAG